jgi:transcriptional regulator with XRE-family HTH domain
MQEEKLRKLNFSERFVDLIESSGMTQKELAAVFNVSEGSMINWKRGRIPKSEELYAVAVYFDVSMEWLLTGDDKQAMPKNEAVSAWKNRACIAEKKLQVLKGALEELLKNFAM